MITHRTLAGRILAASLLIGMATVAANAQSADPDQNMVMPDAHGHGVVNSYGKTDNNDSGRLTEDVYSHGWYCDTSVPAKSVTGCEVGATFKMPPSSQFDPLYITVPLGFTVPPMQMQCPNGIICVDHPPYIDLSLIGGPSNAATPGHDHFTTTRFMGKSEWWNVLVIGVKSRSTYNDIEQHRSFAYIKQLINMHNPNVTKPIPTNLFLYFAVRDVGATAPTL